MFARTARVNRANSLLRAIGRSVVVAGAWALIPAAWPAVVGELAPSCAAPAIDDGRTIHVADYKGRSYTSTSGLRGARRAGSRFHS